MRIPIPRLRPVLLPLLLLCTFHFTPPSANSQSPSLSIGTVIRYPNAAIAQSQYIYANEFLNLLESEISRSFSYQNIFNYIGNTHTIEILRDHNIAIDSEFYSSAGNLSSLQSQMDFVILIEAISPSQARIRLIDMTNGSARANEVCTRTAGFNGHGTVNPSGNQDYQTSFSCIRPFLEASIAAVRQRAEEKPNTPPVSPSNSEATYKDIPAPEQSATSLLDVPPNPDIKPTDDQKQKIADLATQFSQSLNLLDKQNKHWEKFRTELAAQGLSLRADTKQELDLANSEAQRCSQLKANYDVDGLTNCLSKLNGHISRLSSM